MKVAYGKPKIMKPDQIPKLWDKLLGEEEHKVFSVSGGAMIGAAVCGPFCAGAGVVLGFLAAQTTATEVSEPGLEAIGEVPFGDSFEI